MISYVTIEEARKLSLEEVIQLQIDRGEDPKKAEWKAEILKAKRGEIDDID